MLLTLPNLPDPSVPVGTSEADNVVVRTWGEPPRFPFTAKQHFEIGEQQGLLDFERAAKVSGSRFVFYRGDLARLERALVSFMIDVHTERGYTELLPPYLVSRAAMTVTGQLPKFEDDAFETAGPDERFLIPTAEVPVTNYHADEILDGERLPLRYCAFSPCFRAEAGAAGKDTRGLVRMHQFHKVELVKFTRPEQSMDALERMVDDATEVLRRLGLHHRVVAPLHRGPGLRVDEDLRRRGLASRSGTVPGDLLLQQLRRLPGPAGEDPLPPRSGREAPALPHAERFRPGRGAHARRPAGERPARGRHGAASGRARTVHGRTDRVTVSLIAPAAVASGGESSMKAALFGPSFTGGMAERLKAAVLKTAKGSRPS